VSDQPNPAGLQDLLAQLETRQRHDPHDTLVRLAVRLRARDACEYCLLPAKGLFHVDHIIPPDLWIDYAAGNVPGLTPVPERRDPDHLDNLAWCCPFCNGSKARRGGQSQRLFDPRRDTWQEHVTFMRSQSYTVARSIPAVTSSPSMANVSVYPTRASGTTLSSSRESVSAAA